jgi:hypothetical protein
MRILRIVVLLHILWVSAPTSVFAVSYFPAPFFHRQEKLESPMMVGETVYLFQSSKDLVQRTIHVSDVLTVYRIAASCKGRTVGKIKVMSYIGETYIKGLVIEGEIMPGDIARKENVTCLVILTGTCSP